MSTDTMSDISMLLAAATIRQGGVIEVSEAELVELEQTYGQPTPMVMGRDDNGLFCALFALEELEERGWPFLARSMHLPEKAARLVARSMVEGMRTMRAEYEAAEQARKDRSN